MKRICNIVGFDGFDADALANMTAFYAGSGYRVIVTRFPIEADLLVIQRGEPSKQNTFTNLAKIVHIYDYVRNGTSDFAEFTANAETFIISPVYELSGTKKPASASVVKAFYPVVPRLWQLGNIRPPKRYGLVHLGHRKPEQSSGQDTLERLLALSKIYVWGRGWNGPATNTFGAVSLHRCNQIYRQSATAVGNMYGRQRRTSLSGRMWQAPLNGCPLLTEALPPGYKIPGVAIVTNLTEATIEEHKSQQFNLSEIAAKYWQEETRRLAAELRLNYKEPTTLEAIKIYTEVILTRHFYWLFRGAP